MDDQLNPKQQVAAQHVEGPLLVLAGAGSGKTRIVTCRIAHLVGLGVPSSEIVAVTFTNRAAGEMRQRVEHLCQLSPLTCTFHSLCSKILRESIEPLGFTKDFTIFDEDDAEKTLKECFESLGLKEEKSVFKSMRYGISNAKNQLIFAETMPKEDPLLFEVYNLYQRKLKNYNALDFDDLLLKTVELFQKFPEVLSSYQSRWRFILIDEYQDTNAVQYALVKLLSVKHGNVFAVGDPDQSIYSWRGANIYNILNFEKDFPGAEVITLDQNYRSTSGILNAANALIQNNQSRFEKNLWSNLGEGEKIGLGLCDSDLDEVSFVVKKLNRHLIDGTDPEECVIFYRTNFQSRVFEDALLREGIPYEIIGGLSFYQRKEIKDILAYLRLINSSCDMISFSRTINNPKRGLGESALKKIKGAAEEFNLSVFDACIKLSKGEIFIKLSAKQQEGLEGYIRFIFRMREKLAANPDLGVFLQEVMEDSGYLHGLKEDPETYQERKENLMELVSKASQWSCEIATPTLTAFLEELSLKGAADQTSEKEGRIKLMTIHNSKGLEFDCVFLVGMEEDLFPHVNAKDSESQLEEERRLCYVGITRAKKHLYLSASRMRYLWGVQRMMRPSRFLNEIPETYFSIGSRGRSLGFSEPSADGAEFDVGSKVVHRDFGVGVVRKSYNTSLGLTYDVYFTEQMELKSLVAKFAKLCQSVGIDA